MELSSFNIKKNSYISGNGTLHFPAQTKKIKNRKNKKNLPRKKFLIFPEMELSSSNIKKILIFSQKKVFLIFPKMEPCTFQPKLEKKKNPPGEKSYISGNGNPEKNSYISYILGNGTFESKA